MKYSCHVCQFSTNDKKEFKLHLECDEHKTNLEKSQKETDDRKCSTCCKTFSTKQKRNNHMKTCKGIISPLECQYCHKIYSTSSTKCKHEKICSAKEYNNQEIHSSNTTNTDGDHNVNSSNIVGGNVNTINTNSPTNIHFNIHLPKNSFGKENIDYMNDKQMKKFMTSVIKNLHKGISDYINEIYFNKDHPENQTIRFLKKQSAFMEKFMGRKWVQHEKIEMMNELLSHIDNNIKLFLEMTEEYKLSILDLRNFADVVGKIYGWNMFYHSGEDEYIDLNKIYNRKTDPNDPERLVLNSEEKAQRSRCLKELMKMIHEKSKEVKS